MAITNSIMFYKVKFSISVVDPAADLLWKIVMHIKNWQVRKCAKRNLFISRDSKDWTQLKRGGQMLSPDNSLYIKSEFFYGDDGAQFWACQITENLPPEAGHANREWITEIGYEETEKNRAVFSCVVSYRDRAGFIGPYMHQPDPSIPNLIRNIIADNRIRTSCGPDLLIGTATELKPGDWPDFYKRIINPNRQLPYVFISPQVVNQDSGETMHLIQAAPLADKLFGNALVFYSSDPEFSREMRYMNDDYACYGGAIRVYHPNTTDPIKHRYLSATDIESFGEAQVVSFLVRAFSQNVHFYDSFFCMEECQKRKAEYNRKKRLATLHAAHQRQMELAEDEKMATFDLAAQEEEKRLRAESEAEQLRQNLNSVQQENFNLKTQIEQLQAAAEENSSLRLALDARFEVTCLPETADTVVAYFSQVFADKIVFSKDALKSLKGCTLPPAELWKVFLPLQTPCGSFTKMKTVIFLLLFEREPELRQSEAKEPQPEMTKNS